MRQRARAEAIIEACSSACKPRLLMAPRHDCRQSACPCRPAAGKASTKYTETGPGLPGGQSWYVAPLIGPSQELFPNECSA
jgi:hypothetical protein